MPDDSLISGAQDNTVTADETSKTAAESEKAETQTDSLIASAGKETQPETQPEAKTDTKAEEKAPEAKAPEEYADFTLPEDMTLLPELATEAKALFKGLNLTQEQAQSLVDLQAKAVQASAKAQVEGLDTMGKEWAEQTKKELGANLGVELGFAAKARDQVTTPALMQLLNDTRLGNHPEVVKMFIKIGKMVAEDRPASGKTATGAKDPASIMYDSK
jgi:hypothetical protein